jgi:hypothetical protein
MVKYSKKRSGRKKRYSKRRYSKRRYSKRRYSKRRTQKGGAAAITKNRGAFMAAVRQASSLYIKVRKNKGKNVEQLQDAATAHNQVISLIKEMQKDPNILPHVEVKLAEQMELYTSNLKKLNKMRHTGDGKNRYVMSSVQDNV